MTKDAHDRSGSVAAEVPFTLEISLVRDSPVPLYHQISQPLEEKITSGQLPAGTLIEDEVSMARRLKVSRPTARRALQDLVTRGLISRRRGIGTRVTPRHVHRPVGLTSLNEDLTKAGFETRTDVISYEMRLAGAAEALLLQCEEGIEIVRIERLRWSNDEPLAVLVNLIPGDIAPSLTELSSGGLYKCLRDRGVALATAQQAVTARNADQREAELLHMDKGAAMLALTRTVYDQAGRVVEHGDHIYNAARYTLNFASLAD